MPDVCVRLIRKKEGHRDIVTAAVEVPKTTQPILQEATEYKRQMKSVAKTDAGHCKANKTYGGHK